MECTTLPYYNYNCSACDKTFEKKLSSETCLSPESEPGPECNIAAGTVSYRPSYGGIGDPIKLGVTRPDSVFVNEVLGKMQRTVPDGTKKKANGGIERQYANFSKARYSPGRTPV